MDGDGLDARVRAALQTLVPEARTIVLGVSGGSDSVAALRAFAGSDTVRVVVGHVDHGLRPESADDAAFVEALCNDLNVPVRSVRVDVAAVARREGRNLEEAGRTIRYAYLARVARDVGADAVVTAHTRDDAAETVLLQLLRGSAHPVGIRPVRGSVVRPLLDLSKSDVRGWLDHIGQRWREDASNRDLSRDRAWIRHQVLPALERRRPGAAARLARFGRVQAAQADFLRAETNRRFGTGALAREPLAAAPAALRHEALAALVGRAGGQVDAAQIDLLDDALVRGIVTRRDLPGGVRVRLLRDRIDAIPIPKADPNESTPDGVPVRTAERLPSGLPADLLREGSWRLRPPRDGDRIRLPGGTRTVADVLTDAGVPREERPRCTVLADGRRVVWIDGVAVEAGLAEAAADPARPWMRRALELADEAAAHGEVPIGAVVVARDGTVIGEGRNRRESSHDPTDHAEIEAMRAAARRTNDRRLVGATLVVTLEPCPMCAGAAFQTELARIVYGAPNRRDGALGTVVDLSAAPWKRVPEVRGGVLASEASRRLTRFFEHRRAGGDAACGPESDRTR